MCVKFPLLSQLCVCLWKSPGPRDLKQKSWSWSEHFLTLFSFAMLEGFVERCFQQDLQSGVESRGWVLLLWGFSGICGAFIDWLRNCQTLLYRFLCIEDDFVRSELCMSRAVFSHCRSFTGLPDINYVFNYFHLELHRLNIGNKTRAFQCGSSSGFFKVMDKVKLLHCKCVTRVQHF